MADNAGKYIRSPVTHLLWVIAILLLTIACLLVYSPSGEIIYNYVSFASAIASIILAVVAIIYSMISNQGFSESIGRMHSSADNVNREAAKLTQISEKFTTQADKLLERIEDLPDSVDRLSADIGQKLETLSSITVTADGQNGASESLDDPGGKSVASVLALYCMKRGFDLSKEIQADKIFEDRYLRGFMFGFFSCIHVFKPCGIQIEGVKSSFFVKSLGTAQMGNFVQNVEEKSEEKPRKFLNEAKKYFGDEVEPAEDEKGTEEPAEELEE